MSITDDIRSRIDIVDLVSSYGVDLKREGNRFKCCCPLHNERTPSFKINPERQSWYCFGCNKGGDMFNFIMEKEGLDFRGALLLLAERAGVEVNTKRDERLSVLYNALADVSDWYHQLLIEGATPDAYSAYEYALSRGIKDETILKFKIGFAPGDKYSREAFNYLASKGYKPDEIISAGICLETEKKSIFDRFKSRLMFPIYNISGKVVGFGGRALLPEQNPKYLNSPQSEVFDKSQLAYGFYQAKDLIRETKTAIITEGYIDAVILAQEGIGNTICSMGTANLGYMGEVLYHYADTLISLMDGDKAGSDAVLRALPKLQTRKGKSIGAFIATIDKGDPDELALSDMPLLQSVLESAVDAGDWLIDKLTNGVGDKGLKEREKAAKTAFDILMLADTEAQREENLRKLALKVKISERAMRKWKLPKTDEPEPVQSSIDCEYEGRFIAHSIQGYTDWSLFRRLCNIHKIPHLSESDFSDSALRLVYGLFEESTDQWEFELDQWIKDRLPDVLMDEFNSMGNEMDQNDYWRLGLWLKRTSLERINTELEFIPDRIDEMAGNMELIEKITALLNQPVIQLDNIKRVKNEPKTKAL